MSFLVFKPVLLLLSGFALLVVATRAIGAAQPPRSALEGFTDQCAENISLCWKGFEPGYTSKDTSRAIAQSIGYNGFDQPNAFQTQYRASQLDPGCFFVGYSVGGDESRISTIVLGCMALSLGDVISVWGEPEQIGYESFPSLRLYIAYHDSTGRLKVKVALHSSQPLSAFAAVDQITLAWQRSLPNDLASWRGFIPLWRYCQWEVTFAVCP